MLNLGIIVSSWGRFLWIVCRTGQSSDLESSELATTWISEQTCSGFHHVSASAQLRASAHMDGAQVRITYYNHPVFSRKRDPGLALFR